MRHITVCLACVALLPLAACGTTSIGRGPADVDLVNNGSAEDQGALQRKYQLSMEAGLLRRPGADATTVAAEIGQTVAEVATPPHSENAEEYLATSEVAEEVADTGVVAFDRFTHAPTTLGMVYAATIGISAAAGAASALAATSDGFAPSDVNAMLDGAISGGLGGIMLALPVGLVFVLTAQPLSSALAAGDYRKATRAFNKDLSARITAAANVTPPPPPPPALPASAPPLPLSGEAAPDPAAATPPG